MGAIQPVKLDAVSFIDTAPKEFVTIDKHGHVLPTVLTLNMYIHY